MTKMIITAAINGNDIKAETKRKLRMLREANEGQLEYFAGIHKKCKGQHVHIAVMAERDIKIPDGISMIGLTDANNRSTHDIERYISCDAERTIKSRRWPDTRDQSP